MPIVKEGLSRIFSGLDEETDLYYQIWARDPRCPDTWSETPKEQQIGCPRGVIFFVNGSASDLRTPSVSYDRIVSTGHQVLTFDHRGCGRSAVDLDASHYSMRQYAEDAAALMREVGVPLMREMGVPRATIVGISFGGMVAQELVIRHPALCEKLALISTVARVTWNFLEPAMVGEYFLTVESLLVQDLLHYILWPLMVFIAAFTALPDFRRCFKAYCKDVGRECGAAFWDRCRFYCYDARNYHDARGRLGDVKCDVLVLSGHRDGLAPRKAQAELAAEFTGARSTRHIGTWVVGHSVFYDMRMYDRLVDFVDGVLK